VGVSVDALFGVRSLEMSGSDLEEDGSSFCNVLVFIVVVSTLIMLFGGNWVVNGTSATFSDVFLCKIIWEFTSNRFGNFHPYLIPLTWTHITQWL
jgi:hypothetical protein